MVIREQVISYAKDLKANVALLAASGKFSMGKIPPLPLGKTVSVKLPQKCRLMKYSLLRYKRCVVMYNMTFGVGPGYLFTGFMLM